MILTSSQSSGVCTDRTSELIRLGDSGQQGSLEKSEKPRSMEEGSDKRFTQSKSSLRVTERVSGRFIVLLEVYLGYINDQGRGIARRTFRRVWIWGVPLSFGVSLMHNLG